MSGTNFTDILAVFVFLLVVWSSGRVCRLVGISPIVGEIGMGIALGPNALELFDDSDSYTSTFELMGTLGVTFLIFESGMHLHTKGLKEFGLTSFFVAVVGTMAPIGLGMATMVAMGFDPYPDAFAAGASLAPTSVGIVLKLLNEHKLLDSAPGQTIVTAAFIDDIFSIVTLVVLLETARDISAWGVAQPFVFSFLFVVCGGFIALKVAPTYIPLILKRIPPTDKQLQPRDEAHLGLMCVCLVLSSWLASLTGSHLLGAFIAGVLFAEVPRSMLVWRRQFKHVIHWLVRIFFGATVAFVIPVRKMFSWEAFGMGLGLFLFGTLLPKLLCGVWVGDERWIIGWAMVARGEFAFLVAQESHETKRNSTDTLMSGKAFSVVVWALLWATLVSPIVFRKVLLQFAESVSRSKSMEADIVELEVRVEGHRHPGLLRELVGALHALELQVTEAHIETDGFVDAEIFVVRPYRSKHARKIGEDKVAKIRHSLLEVLDDEQGQIIINRVYAAPVFNGAYNVKFDGQVSSLSESVLDVHATQRHFIEIRLMGGHHAQIFPSLIEALNVLRVEVIRCSMQQFDGVDYDVITCHDKLEYNDSSTRRQVIHDALCELFKNHNMKGQVMVKISNQEHGNRSSPRSSPMAKDRRHSLPLMGVSSSRLLKDLASQQNANSIAELALLDLSLVVTRGNTPLMLTHISKALRDMNLEVVEADYNVEGGVGSFVVHDNDAPDPQTDERNEHTLERLRFIRKHLMSVLFALGVVVEVSVVPSGDAVAGSSQQHLSGSFTHENLVDKPIIEDDVVGVQLVQFSKPEPSQPPLDRAHSEEITQYLKSRHLRNQKNNKK